VRQGQELTHCSLSQTTRTRSTPASPVETKRATGSAPTASSCSCASARPRRPFSIGPPSGDSSRCVALLLALPPHSYEVLVAHVLLPALQNGTRRRSSRTTPAGSTMDRLREFGHSKHPDRSEARTCIDVSSQKGLRLVLTPVAVSVGSDVLDGIKIVRPLPLSSVPARLSSLSVADPTHPRLTGHRPRALPRRPLHRVPRLAAHGRQDALQRPRAQGDRPARPGRPHSGRPAPRGHHLVPPTRQPPRRRACLGHRAQHRPARPQ